MYTAGVVTRPPPKLYGGYGILCTALAVLAAPCAGEASGLTAVRAVEPPPSQYASGPTQYGATVERTFSNPEELEAFCNLYLGRPASGYYQACYIPALDTVAIPDKRAWPSAREREALREHEWAHARGWRHGLLTTASAARY
jgi:hypothetical protein